MSTEHPSIDDASPSLHAPEGLRHAGPEHLTLLPLTGAVVAVAAGGEWAWPVAASLLAVAYLASFLLLRRDREV